MHRSMRIWNSWFFYLLQGCTIRLFVALLKSDSILVRVRVVFCYFGCEMEWRSIELARTVQRKEEEDAFRKLSQTSLLFFPFSSLRIWVLPYCTPCRYSHPANQHLTLKLTYGRVGIVWSRRVRFERKYFTHKYTGMTIEIVKCINL